MFIKINSSTVYGLEAHFVEIEIDACGGLPNYILVGLPDTAIKESKERIFSAIRNSGLNFPVRKLTINLAPADLMKKGTIFDLPIALGILAASNQINQEALVDVSMIGELSLDGKVRRVNGVLPMCLLLKDRNIKKVLLPAVNAREGALVNGLEIIPISNLGEAVAYLNKQKDIPPFELNIEKYFKTTQLFEQDFLHIKGQIKAKKALEISAAGGHNLLMVGSPGSGKTLLARSFNSILPPLSMSEALEVTKLYSIGGLLKKNEFLITQRVFRSPHHTVSHIGLVGGGTFPKPGEVSLAHRGVLFLDETPEFQKISLEVLRQPLEDGEVTISRAATSVTFPADFTLIAAMNPCPCGYHLDIVKDCQCSLAQIKRYWAKLSGPLLDRIDLQIEVPRLSDTELMELTDGESSEAIRARVMLAVDRQKNRFTKHPRIQSNSQIPPSLIRKICRLTTPAEKLLLQANRKYHFSARGFDRLLKTSRTIADLQGDELIDDNHLAQALQYKKISWDFS